MIRQLRPFCTKKRVENLHFTPRKISTPEIIVPVCVLITKSGREGAGNIEKPYQFKTITAQQWWNLTPPGQA